MPESNLETPQEPTGLTPELLEEARQSDPRVAQPATDEPEAKKDDAPAETPAADEPAEETEDEPAEEEAEPEEKAGAPKMGLWDKGRQARDQEQANERKALQAEVAELRKQVASAATAAEKKADKSGTKTDEAKADALADIETQAMELADGIDANADAPAIGKAVKGALGKLFAAVKTVKAEHGNSTQVQALQAKLESIETALNESKTAEAEAKKADAERRALESQDAHIEGLDDKYGARYHNAAIKAARKMMEEDGFSDAKRPSLAYSKRVLDLAYASVAGKHVKAPAKPQGARPDSITGGKAPNTDYIKPGKLEDVKRQILASKRK